MSTHAPGRIPGYGGEVDNVSLLPEGEPSLPAGPDLVEMARRALGYLSRNPDAEHGYQNRFSFFLLRRPPFAPSALMLLDEDRESYFGADHIDPVTIGDTESRNDIAFNQMRDMTACEDGRDVQEIVHARLVGYVRSGTGERCDDLCWAEPFCMSSERGLWAMPWTSAKLLQSAVDRFRLTGEEAERALARRLFDGFRRISTDDTGRAYIPSGGCALRPDAVAGGYGGHYPIVLGALTDYWRFCGDPEALAFARAIAEGFLSDLQPGHHHQPDGRVEGHNHAQMHAVRGVAQLGALTGDWRYLDWAKAAYDFHASSAFDTGWLPEIVQAYQTPDHNNHSETCLCADMLEMAVWLARGGRPRYWDRVERAIRNYFAPAHFVLSPEIESFWRAINHDATEEQTAFSLRQLREMEGGFLSALTPNDRVFEVAQGGDHAGVVEYDGHRIVMDMMGCCPPEGMRAIYLAWSNTVVQTGQGVFVNLALAHDGPLAAVTTEMPRAGLLRVTVTSGGDYWLRPPSWASRDQVRAERNGRRIETRWGGPAHDYIAFPGAQRGDVLELRWPLVRFTQQVTMRCLLSMNPDVWRYGDTFAYEWVGNSVASVQPKGKWLPLYE